MLEDFQAYSQEENGEGPEDFLTAGTGQEEQQERTSSERQPMDHPVVGSDHAGPGRLEGADNQEGNPHPGDDEEHARRERRAAGFHRRRSLRHYLGAGTTGRVLMNGGESWRHFSSNHTAANFFGKRLQGFAISTDRFMYAGGKTG